MMRPAAHDLDPLLDRARELAGAYLAGLAERPGAARRAAPTACAWPLPDAGHARRGGARRAGRGGGARARRLRRARATSASSPAARCPRRSPRTGSPPRGTRTPRCTPCPPPPPRSETAVTGWVLDLLGLPREAPRRLRRPARRWRNVTALAAARHAVLARAGWDVEERRPAGRAAGARPRRRGGPRDGVHGAAAARPRPRHGRARARRRPGPHARRRAATRRSAGDREPTIVCAQAGNVNTGAFDPLAAIVDGRHAHGAWCTSTAPSASGRRPPRAACTSWPAPPSPTRGPSTRTSGSTCPTTAAFAIVRDPEPTARP